MFVCACAHYIGHARHCQWPLVREWSYWGAVPLSWRSQTVRNIDSLTGRLIDWLLVMQAAFPLTVFFFVFSRHVFSRNDFSRFLDPVGGWPIRFHPFELPSWPHGFVRHAYPRVPWTLYTHAFLGSHTAKLSGAHNWRRLDQCRWGWGFCKCQSCIVAESERNWSQRSLYSDAWKDSQSVVKGLSFYLTFWESNSISILFRFLR